MAGGRISSQRLQCPTTLGLLSFSWIQPGTLSTMKVSCEPESLKNIVCKTFLICVPFFPIHVQQWGSAIVFNQLAHQDGTSKSMVNVMRLSEFVLYTVAKRQLPETALSKAPTVVMKMDIEGG